MRSYAWLCACIGVVQSATHKCSQPEEAAASGQLLQRSVRQLEGRHPDPNYGLPGCPCIGFDGLNRSGTASPIAGSGAHCDQWNRSCKEETCEAWCFVDPCHCNVSSRPTAATEQLSWQGHNLHASSETCKPNNMNSSAGAEGHSKGKTHAPGFCDTFDEDQYGSSKCKCIGIEHLAGNVSVQVEGESVEYPIDLGSHCGQWDDQASGPCSKSDRPSWCGKSWCYVDPCACGLAEPPKVSGYFPKATYGKKPLYYSYETCGSFDSFTIDSRGACVNQETEARCLALGADPEDPEMRKCAWGGPEIKCLGKELLHLCQVNDQIIRDWTWWSFSHGDVQRGNIAPAVATSLIYALILLFFLMVLRGLA